SWCWGFAPVIDALQAAHPQLPLHLVVGGLRPGVTDPLSEATRRTLGEHWQAVGRTSGQPLLTPDALPDGFIYNTEPACRALVVARELDPQCVWLLVRAIQAAFYTHARDVTQCQILIEQAEQVGHHRQRFRRALIAEQAVPATAADVSWVADLRSVVSPRCRPRGTPCSHCSAAPIRAPSAYCRRGSAGWRRAEKKP